MNTIKKLSYVANILCLIGVIYILAKNDDKKTAFFSNAQVYNEFDYKKELEYDLEQTNSKDKWVVDSLERDLQANITFMKSIEKPSDQQLIELEKKQNYYFQYRNKVEDEYATRVQEYYNLIWGRINGYVNEYGQDNQFAYIFGANGDGTVMYADNSEDITEDIITYINTKYKGE